MEQEVLINQLRAIANDAIVANKIAYADIQASSQTLWSNISSGLNQQIVIEKTINDWHIKSGNTERQSVEQLCAIIEKEMAGQMDWFNGLEDSILNWCSDLDSTTEYRNYKKSRNSEIDLLPLLRKGDLATIRRVIEEFSEKDFNAMFGHLKQ